MTTNDQPRPAPPSATQNAKWIAAAQIGKVGLQMATLVALTRLLTPAEMGLIAMLLVISNFVAMLRDFGTASAIIRAPVLEEGFAATVYWFNVAVGLGLAVLVLALAWPFARLLRHEELTPLIWWTVPAILVTALGSVHKAMLERISRFAAVAVIETLGSAAALACTVLLAWRGQGAFSWVAGALLGALVSTGLLLWHAAWRPPWVWSREHFREVMGYSGHLSAFNIVIFFARNVDAIVIGRYLGAVELGFYSAAYRVMQFPMNNLTQIANRAMFPVMSHHQADLGKVASLYLNSVGFIFLITAPLMVGVFVLREPLVNVLLGDQWARAADVLAWLAPVGLLHSVVGTTGTVSMVSGRTDLLFRVGLLGAVMQVAGFFIGVQYSVVAVAACYCIANLLNALPAFWVATRQLGVGFGALSKEMGWSALASTLMGSALWLGLRALPPGQVADVLVLVAGAVLGGAFYLALMAVFDRPRLTQTLARLRRR